MAEPHKACVNFPSPTYGEALKKVPIPPNGRGGCKLLDSLTLMYLTGAGVDPHHHRRHGDDVLMSASDDVTALSEVMAKQLIIVPKQLLKVGGEFL